MLYGFFAGNSKFLAAIPSAVRQHSASISRGHSFTKTVLVFSFFAGRLKSTFHVLSINPSK